MNQTECTLRHSDCYHAARDRECWNCSRNTNHNKVELSDNYITVVNKVTELYDYLAGSALPKGVECWQPKMSKKHAFDVIWFLQEITHCLPDHIEQCQGCDGLFDTDCEGCHFDDQYDLDGETLPEKYWGHWCDNCIPCTDAVLG